MLSLFLVNLAESAKKSSDSFDRSTRYAVKKGVQGQEIRIVPLLNKLNFGLGHHGEIEYYFSKTISRIFFQDERINARVTDIEFEGTKITLELFNPVLGDGTIEFVFDEDIIAALKASDIKNILLSTLSDENNQYVFCDPQSKKCHLYTGLHLKKTDVLDKLTLDDAEKQGFVRCGFCFKHMEYLPDLSVETAIEREWITRLQDYELLLDGTPQHAKVKELGEEILRNWPVPLIGYDYSFHLISSPKLSAFAIPTGTVVATSALMEALENEEELEAVLLIAIAHIERRHALQDYRLRLAGYESTFNLKQLLSAAGSFAGVFAGASGAMNAITDLAFPDAPGMLQPLAVFRKSLQHEADAMAALYFDIHNKDRKNLISLIKKLQFNELSEQLHPDMGGGNRILINGRTQSVKDLQFSYFNNQKSFVLQRKEKLPVQLDFIYQSISKNENKLVVYLNNKNLLKGFIGSNDGSRIELSIKAKDSNYTFKLDKRLLTEDLWGLHLTFFTSAGENKTFFKDIQSVSLDLQSGHKGSDGEEPKIESFKFVAGKLGA
jgi:Zn-dependent protease with chaperone function